MDPIEGFDSLEFEAGDIRHPVYLRGEGPGVILMHELPGMSDACIDLARRLAGEGYRVYMPLFFGRPGRISMLGNSLKVCISREFRVFAARRSSPIVDWLRALGRRAHQECGGPGVGAIGMCLTGNFALGLMVDEHLLAPVASQPSLPIVIGSRRKKSELALSPGELAKVKERAGQGVTVLGLRFTGDKICPPQRFERLRSELGDAFEGLEIDSSPGNPHGIAAGAHSVLTDDLVDREGHPTRAALDRVLDFLDQRLR